jgi:hypothetical protein
MVVSIGSTTQSTLKYEDIVASLLSKEMRWKNMDGHSTYALSIRGCPQDRNPKSSLPKWGGGGGVGSKYKGRYESLGKIIEEMMEVW